MNLGHAPEAADERVGGGVRVLVVEERDDAEERLEEIIEYLSSKCVEMYQYRPTVHRGPEYEIAKYISLV